MSSDFEAWVRVEDIQDEIKRMTGYRPSGPLDFESKDRALVTLAERLAGQFALLGLGPDGKETNLGKNTEAPAPAPAPVGVLDCMVTDRAGPLPVNTRAMADSFAGLRWSGERWVKNLGNKPKWLEPCMAVECGQGEGMRQWNPVLIGAYLLRMGHVKPSSVRARFRTKDALKPWFDEWETYEEDNWPTD